MRTLPTTMIQVLAPFAPLFSKRLWAHVQVLLAGAILAPGKRTVTSALRAVGLEEERQFCRYHRVLNRAVWSGKEATRMLVGLLVEALVPEGPLVLGVDETLERRRGKKIAAKGVYRDHSRALRQDEWPQMDLRGALGRSPVGFSSLGPAISLSVGPLRALRQRAGQAAQETDRLGVAAASYGETLVPTARDSSCR